MKDKALKTEICGYKESLKQCSGQVKCKILIKPCNLNDIIDYKPFNLNCTALAYFLKKKLNFF